MKTIKKIVSFVLTAAVLALGAGALAETETNGEATEEVVDDAYEMVAFVEGIDGEAITLIDAKGENYMLSFTEDYPRTAMDESIIAGDPVDVVFYGAFEEEAPYTGTVISIEKAANIIDGTVAGIDGEAITVTDADGATCTFFFNDFLLREELPEAIVEGAEVEVAFVGEMDENNQLAADGLFAIAMIADDEGAVTE